MSSEPLFLPDLSTKHIVKSAIKCSNDTGASKRIAWDEGILAEHDKDRFVVRSTR